MNTYTARYKPTWYYPGGYWIVYLNGEEIDKIAHWVDVVRRYPELKVAA